jgi:DNA-binding GntR family transcriptional regulator
MVLEKVITIRNSKQKVFESVRNFIIDPGLPPGSKIDEAYLAESLGVSKTPIREALSVLAAEGIVEIKPNRGSFKVKLTDQDITEIMLIRESLECLCVRLAAENMKKDVIKELGDLLDEFEAKDFEKEYQSYIETNIRFYEIIYRTAKSPKLVNLIQSMRDLTQMIRLKYMKNPDNVRYSLTAHRELIAAFEKRHPKLAEGIRKKMLRYGYHYQMSR